MLAKVGIADLQGETALSTGFKIQLHSLSGISKPTTDMGTQSPEYAVISARILDKRLFFKGYFSCYNQYIGKCAPYFRGFKQESCLTVWQNKEYCLAIKRSVRSRSLREVPSLEGWLALKWAEFGYIS